MMADEIEFERDLVAVRKLVQKRRTATEQKLVRNPRIADGEGDFRYLAGEIRACDDVLDMIDQILKTQRGE